MPKLSPALIIFAGANGSGKTTVARYLLPKRGIKEFVNADEIARGLSPLNPSRQAIAAGKLVLKRTQELIAHRISFAIETTLSGKHIKPIILKAQRAGYTVELHYIFCADININLKRIKNRVKQGGHNVPAKDVRRRYWRSLKNWLMPYKDICDKMHIYDTTSGENQEIASWDRNRDMVRYDDALCKRFVDMVLKARDEH